MSASGETLAKRARARRLGALPQRDDVVLQHAESYPAFGDFLAEFSAAILNVEVDNIEHEIARWLDQLAHELGAECCTVGEFNAVDHADFHLQWSVGKQPTPLISPEDSWIRSRLTAGKSVAIASLDEIPAEALSTRQILEEVGIRSGIWVPLVAEGSVMGGIGFTVLSHELIWPQHIIWRCQLVGQLIGSALLKRRRSAELEERSQFEVLATDISARFMNVGQNTDALIDEVLSELGEFLKADRISYVEINAEENSLRPTRHWFAEGIEPDNSVLNVNVSAQFSWMMAIIKAGEPVAIDKMDQFPDEATNERQYCEQLGIQSFMMVPAMLGGEVVAALALDSFRERRIWDESVLVRLEMVAGIIAGAQHRVVQQRDLDKLRSFESAAASISTKFVNLPPDSVDAEIEAGLRAVAKSLDVQLVTLLQPFGEVDNEVTHEWASEELSTVQFKGTHVAQAFPWLAVRLRQNETIAISALSDFPAEAKNEVAAMQSAGLESVLWVPFEVRGQLAGHLAINTVRQRTWSKELVPRLKLLGEVFGEALWRLESELQLRRSLDEVEALKEQLRQEKFYLRMEAKLTYEHGDIIGDSASLKAALIKAEQVAPTGSTVLILGETGTGKELLARAIHNISSRGDKLMVTVNCAALPSSLVEAELFGREKGAYTGALTRELGRFEIADGSTILLDEIGELSLNLQAKLLRILQEGEFERLGSSTTRKVDVRVLASTNRDLTKAVENKEFRVDLFYRLNVFPIELPPLRNRIEDIPQLVWMFVQKFSEAMGKTVETIPVGAMDSLMAYTWPGNVREVRNIVDRAMIVNQGPVLEITLPGDAVVPVRGAVASGKLEDVEREHIRAVIESTGWRIRGSGGAAEILGLKPTTLEARMKKLGLVRSNRK